MNCLLYELPLALASGQVQRMSPGALVQQAAGHSDLLPIPSLL